MRDAVVVEDVGKVYRRYTDRPLTLRDMLIRGWRSRNTAERFRALSGISFRLAGGRALGVIGRNGAGKSTLLNVVGGISRASEGRVRTCGRLRALLDLGASFHPELTGRENVFVAGIVAGLTRREVESRFSSIVQFAELESFIDNPVRTYSSGMRLRLAFAAAIHTDPDILLVDEVLAVGDQAFQYKCLDRIAELKAGGCAILLVSHDTPVVEQFCDDVLWLRAGRVEAYGPAKEVVDRYVGDLMNETRRRMVGNRPPARASSGHELRFNENRFGSLEAEIVGVSFLDSGGRQVEEIEHGEALTVQIDYRASRPYPGAHAGVTISREDGLVCFDATTAGDGHVLPPITEAAQVRLTLERLDLVAGSYFVDVGLYEREWAYAYDLHWHAYPLRVRGPAGAKGVVSVPHRWLLPGAVTVRARR